MSPMETYQKTVDELAESARNISNQPPELDIKGEIESFCGKLRLTPREQRFSEMQRKVRTTVDKGLQQWRLSVEHAPSLLVKLHNIMEQIDADKSEREQVIEISKAKARDFDFELGRLQDRKKKLGRNKENLKPLSPFDRMSYRILIIGSLLVGIVTAWYYLGMQLLMQASKMEQEFKGTLSFLKEHPEDVVYIFGVVIFLLSGKIISVIHHKLDHPKWLYLVVGTAAVALTVSTVIVIANVSIMQQQIVQIDDKIKNNYNPDAPFGSSVDCESADKDSPQCVEDRKLKAEKSLVVEKVVGQSFWMTILVMLSEIMLGSVAWMQASEYHAKLGAAQANEQGLQGIEEQEKHVKTQIQEQRDLETKAEHDRKDADRLIHRLQELQSSIPSRDYIERSAKAVFEHELDNGKEILNAFEMQWAEDDARLRSAT